MAYKADLMINPTIRAKQYSIIGGHTIPMKQKGGFGVQSSALLNYKLNDKRQVEFGPFVRFWKVPDSEEVMFYGIPFDKPSNSTYEVGVQLNHYF